MTSPLLEELLKKRAELEDYLMAEPSYKEMCAVNYLIEREYISLAGEEIYAWFDTGFSQVVADFLVGADESDGSPAPDTGGGRAFVSNLAKGFLRPTRHVAPVEAAPTETPSEEPSPTEAPTETPVAPPAEDDGLPDEPPATGKPRGQYEWTDQQRADLFKLRDKGWSWPDIGKYLGRSAAACSSMYNALQKAKGQPAAPKKTPEEIKAAISKAQKERWAKKRQEKGGEAAEGDQETKGLNGSGARHKTFAGPDASQIQKLHAEGYGVEELAGLYKTFDECIEAALKCPPMKTKPPAGKRAGVPDFSGENLKVKD